jgi:death-on-curing protein
METFLVLNGVEITANVDEQEQVMLGLAAGEMTRESLVQWLQKSTVLLRH